MAGNPFTSDGKQNNNLALFQQFGHHNQHFLSSSSILAFRATKNINNKNFHRHDSNALAASFQHLFAAGGGHSSSLTSSSAAVADSKMIPSIISDSPLNDADV